MSLPPLDSGDARRRRRPNRPQHHAAAFDADHWHRRRNAGPLSVRFSLCAPVPGSRLRTDEGAAAEAGRRVRALPPSRRCDADPRHRADARRHARALVRGRDRDLKTEPVQIALFGLLVLGDARARRRAAVGDRDRGRDRDVVQPAPKDRRAAGLRPGGLWRRGGRFFALSATGFRGAILALAPAPSCSARPRPSPGPRPPDRDPPRLARHP